MYPYKYNNRQPLNLRLGIKSSFSKIRNAIALAYCFYIANDKKHLCIYSKQDNDSISIDETLKQKIELLLGGIEIDSFVKNSSLFLAQLEHIQVTFELLFGLGRINFVNQTKNSSLERTGGKRYQKQILFSSQIRLLDIIINSYSKEEQVEFLLSWLKDTPSSNKKLEIAICEFLTILSERCIFKLKFKDDDDLYFQQEGIIKAILESNDHIAKLTKEEVVGTLRVFNSFVNEELHRFISKSKGGFTIETENISEATEYLYEQSVKLDLLESRYFNETKQFEQLEIEDIKDAKDYNTNYSPLQQIYYGAPGTGKSHTIDGVVTEDNSVRTTFHPDSDYASFVGAYKPTMGNIKISVLVGKEIQYALPQEGHPGTEQKIVYKYVPQAFLKAYVEAWKRYNPEKDEPFYLVIEEINRGNCAQIFGDLFQLLDRNNMGSSSYPINADDDIEQFLATDEKGFAGLTEEQKDIISNFILVKDNDKTENIGESILKGKKLLLPPNLRIWATMNTSDQSLFPIDSAFKRRWDWKYMPIDYNPIDNNGNPILWTFEIGKKQYSWGKFLEKINPEIYTLTESSDKQMGYFFAKADPQTDIISEDVFLNKVLFYLWTDVFKDYDVSSVVFKNKKKNRSFRFTDFFEDPEALRNFIENLGLKPIGGQDNTTEEDDSEESKSSLKFKVGESFPIPQRKLALTALEQYVNNNPDITAEELITEWEPLSNVPHFIESEEEHQKTIATATSFEERTQKVELQNGDIVYVSLHGWIPKTSQEFMDAVNAKDWGIDISILSE